MQKFTRALALSAVFALALPALASAHDWHGRGHGWGYGHYGHGGPVAYGPVAAPCPPAFYGYGPSVVYAPVVYAPPVYYPRPVYVAPAPVFFPPAISVRTPHVAVTIGGWLPF
jgi:hypothetical protein